MAPLLSTLTRFFLCLFLFLLPFSLLPSPPLSLSSPRSLARSLSLSLSLSLSVSFPSHIYSYGHHQIFLMPANASMNPYKEHADPTALGWSMWVEDKGKGFLVPPEEQQFPECLHLDHCAGWSGQGKKAGWATFRLPRMGTYKQSSLLSLYLLDYSRNPFLGPRNLLLSKPY